MYEQTLPAALGASDHAFVGEGARRTFTARLETAFLSREERCFAEI